MAEVVTVLYGLLGGALGALAIAKLLGKWLVQHQLDKALRTHEAHLAEKADVLKTQLSIYAHEQNIAVARVDSQRARALHDIYACLRAWMRPVAMLVAGSPLRNVGPETQLSLYAKLCEEAHSASSQFFQVLADSAIYVDADLYAELGTLVAECGESVASVLVPLRQGPAEGWPVTQIANEVEAERTKFIQRHQEVILPAVQRITSRFREVLGVSRAP
jgi:hypothetical protein